MLIGDNNEERQYELQMVKRKSEFEWFDYAKNEKFIQRRTNQNFKFRTLKWKNSKTECFGCKWRGFAAYDIIINSHLVNQNPWKVGHEAINLA